MKKLLWSIWIVSLLGLAACGKSDKEEVDPTPPPGQTDDDKKDDNEQEEDYITDMELAFPDPIFRTYVLENFDTDGNGKISEGEALAVKKIDVSGSESSWKAGEGIASLKGVEYFTNLTELSCYYNQLTSLDVSNNTQLDFLHCGLNQLTLLDLSNNTLLDRLNCHSNQLTALDVSNNTRLLELRCSGNQLTSLDVSNNTQLVRLDCWYNQLTALDVSNNT